MFSFAACLLIMFFVLVFIKRHAVVPLSRGPTGLCRHGISPLPLQLTGPHGMSLLTTDQNTLKIGQKHLLPFQHSILLLC